ncbi:MAG: aspartate carbamoyltransferase [Gemmatimonadetes bacterium]|nr:aspartate carbamoyltransferase [Gemmatimonadota bacterium]NNK63750.1 aspartate carbamoyltransferase [Gemmatimonadota bacterium]
MRILAVIVIAPLLFVSGCADGETTQRQAEVAEAGSMVMPFDLDRSTHIFEKTDFGGIQVVASDDGDVEQLRLIRDHLAEEAERFSQGDFHDPAMIHGDDMAGMHALVMGHDRITITYRDVDRGGEIRWESEDLDLIQAIHDWFDAQVSDHGEHAQAHR